MTTIDTSVARRVIGKEPLWINRMDDESEESASRACAPVIRAVKGHFVRDGSSSTIRVYSVRFQTELPYDYLEVQECWQSLHVILGVSRLLKSYAVRNDQLYPITMQDGWVVVRLVVYSAEPLRRLLDIPDQFVHPECNRYAEFEAWNLQSARQLFGWDGGTPILPKRGQFRRFFGITSCAREGRRLQFVDPGSSGTVPTFGFDPLDDDSRRTTEREANQHRIALSALDGLREVERVYSKV